MQGAVIRACLTVAVVTAALVVPLAGPAGAGGDMCHAPITEGRGDTVELANLCFNPGILRVQPGTEVTFVNRESLQHIVSASGWGRYENMLRGDAFRATFDQPGIYPFACSYHPGMVGAVVVGDGSGAGSGESVTVGSLPADVNPGAGEDTLAAAWTGEQGTAAGWVGGGILGLAVGAGLGLVWRRRGRKEPSTG